MKTLYRIILICVYSMTLGKADDLTNKTYVTIDASTQERVEDTNPTPESFEAESDKSGNWGASVDGVQLSIRFQKTRFKTNEPIASLVLWRNCSTNELVFRAASNEARNFEFFITDENGKQIKEKANKNGDSRWEAGAAHGIKWPPGTQYRFKFDLLTRYDLSKPGKFSICVRRQLPGTHGQKVSSKVTTIEILE